MEAQQEEVQPAGIKSKNQLKNDAKREEKLAKFTAKQSKLEAEKKEAKKIKEVSYAASTSVLPIEVPVDGQKKSLSAPMAAAYSPKAVEAGWYGWWEREGFFSPDYSAAAQKPFVLPIPPPNVTGALHLGHAMMTSIQDAIVRFKRMQGFSTLYVPGCDHAGIATQVVVEKRLKKEKGLSRHALGREAFVEEIWKWKNQLGDRIYDQLKRMAVSTDWSKACFTMDAKFVAAVEEAFVRLHQKGLIFRDNRLVNWSARIQTTLSDLEVDCKELTGRTLLPIADHEPGKLYEFGVLTYFAYRLHEHPEAEIVVATTRPETFFGDVAIAVNPTDERYKALIGRLAVHPVSGRLLPIIGDDFVEIAFGTGAVKITPAHDAADFKMAKRHGLPMINIFDETNHLNAECANFCGMRRFDARIAVIAFLKEKQLWRDEKEHAMQLPICSRSGDIVEPRLKPQWWLSCQSMAAQAMAAVREGKLEILPKEGEREWFRWLENIQDWCISRQLWWGHRIPVWHVDFVGQVNADLDAFWVCAKSKQEALEIAQKRFPDRQILLSQDEDVLDTWFSSGLWPFGIFGWPSESAELQKYFPNALLETGKDILFFWVARMVMMSLELTGQVPFRQVLLHSIVRDAHGQKLSKSLGNAVDPIDVIEGISLEALHRQLEHGNLDPKDVRTAKEAQKKDFPRGIPECGTDALRFALCASTSLSRDVNLDILRVEGYRRFCNKIWNATKFALLRLADWQPAGFQPCSLLDHWILHRLNCTIEAVTSGMEKYAFMAATSAIHSFWLYDLCDVYIEGIKPLFEAEAPAQAERRNAQAILHECLHTALHLLHPFMPFVSEELFQRLPKKDATPSIMISRWPTCQDAWHFPSQEKEFCLVLEVARGLRSAAAAGQAAGKCSVEAVLLASNSKDRQLLQAEESVVLQLAKGIASLTFTEQAADGQAGIELPGTSGIKAFLLPAGQ